MEKNQKKRIVKTGIDGLDDVLRGGWLPSRVFLIEGSPGAGKTTLALQFLREGLKNNEKCLYITLSESKEELSEVAYSHGWDLEGIDVFELMSEDFLQAETPGSFFHPSEVEMLETDRMIRNKISTANPDRIVIDSLSELKLLAQDTIKMRRQILSLKSYFLKQGATVLLLDDKTTNSNTQELQSIVHGVVVLDQLAQEFGMERRRLRVAKFRSVAFRGGYHDFIIEKGGLKVFPRLVALPHGVSDGAKKLKSNVGGIDELLGGGIECGSATLIMGPAGCGKSTIAIQYVAAAAERGDNTAVFTFDEGIKTLITRSHGLGIDLNKHIDSGKLAVRQVDPAELSPGEFAYYIREYVEQSQCKVIVIDSLNGYINAMPEERFLVIQMHELLSYLSHAGVTTFMIVAQHGLVSDSKESPVDVSYLADNVILLRYFENFGEVRRAISVVKKRAGDHERTIRELTFSKDGIALGLPLSNFQGVLSGNPIYIENVEANKI